MSNEPSYSEWEWVKHGKEDIVIWAMRNKIGNKEFGRLIEAVKVDMKAFAGKAGVIKV